MEMKCPKCRSATLDAVEVENVRVDRCPACSGIWFDAQELGQLLAQNAWPTDFLHRGDATPESSGKGGVCPRDAAPLLRAYSAMDRSVILDTCPDCGGIWLDDGEYEKLLAARWRLRRS